LNHTIYDTPGLAMIMELISMICLKLFGWKIEGKKPDLKKVVIIAAPHTSNWDLPFTLFISFVLKMPIFWMGKNAIFKRPFKGLFKWLGGIPIDRTCSNSVVKQSINQFKKRDELLLAIPPSGTRAKVTYWKTGFYHIAMGAKVPIALGFLDYRRKTGGFGPLIHPTGNIDADMEIIQNFYKNITGKHPEKSTTLAKIKKSSDYKS